MAATASKKLAKCAIHTMTNKPWSLRQCIENYTAAGIRGISVWRNVVEPVGKSEAARMLRESGMHVPSLVRGGFFPSVEQSRREAAIDENKRAIDEAREIGAQMLVLVVGAVPGMPLDEGRKQAAEGIAAILDHARDSQIKLAVEPLHPMYAADKSCINRMAEARKVCDQLDDPIVGIAVDVYHVWWDPDLQSEIELAGEKGRLFGFHVCDWRVKTRDLLTDRGLMGDGCIDLKTIRQWMEKAGFTGFHEIEVFSEEYWATDQAEYVKKIRDAYLEHL